MQLLKKLVLCALSLLVICVPLVAQEGSEAPAEEGEEAGVYLETIDVNIVNVDVWVTDKKGNPITGLTMDDFEVLEDGRPIGMVSSRDAMGPELEQFMYTLIVEEQTRDVLA